MNSYAGEVLDLVARQLGHDDADLDDRLVEDLGAESVDLVTIVAILEEDYQVKIAEERLPLLRTARDLAAEIARLRDGG
jgi:acyl carrier protein